VTPDGINLEGASYVVIDRFVVNGRTRTGVRAVTASHVTVRLQARLQRTVGILTGFVDDFLAEGTGAPLAPSTGSTSRTRATGRSCGET
jgi:hypothetical protein